MAPTATREGRRRAKGMDRRWELKEGGAAACTSSGIASEDIFILRVGWCYCVADGMRV